MPRRHLSVGSDPLAEKFEARLGEPETGRGTKVTRGTQNGCGGVGGLLGTCTAYGREWRPLATQPLFALGSPTRRGRRLRAHAPPLLTDTTQFPSARNQRRLSIPRNFQMDIDFGFNNYYSDHYFLIRSFTKVKIICYCALWTLLNMPT